MDDFNTIRLKRKTISKFKEYSRKISPSYSETLDFMIAYFEDNNISPYDQPNRSGFRSMVNILDRRMDAITTILREIEKTQLKPTKEILESLFEGMEEVKEPKYIGRSQEDIEAMKTLTEENLEYYSEAYHTSQSELQLVKSELVNLLDKLSFVKSTFGKDYFRLDMTKEEMGKIRSRLLDNNK